MSKNDQSIGNNPINQAENDINNIADKWHEAYNDPKNDEYDVFDTILAALTEYKNSLPQDHHTTMKNFSREDMLKVIRKAYDNGESNATRQYGDAWESSNSEKILTEYLNSKK